MVIFCRISKGIMTHRNSAPSSEVRQFLNILLFILFPIILMVSQVYLNFIDLLQDFTGIGFDIRSYYSKIISVLDLMCLQILFHVDNLYIDLSQADLHMNPDRDDCNQKCQETDCLGYRYPKNCRFHVSFFIHKKRPPPFPRKQQTGSGWYHHQLP